MGSPSITTSFSRWRVVARWIRLFDFYHILDSLEYRVIKYNDRVCKETGARSIAWAIARNVSYHQFISRFVALFSLLEDENRLSQPSMLQDFRVKCWNRHARNAHRRSFPPPLDAYIHIYIYIYICTASKETIESDPRDIPPEKPFSRFDLERSIRAQLVYCMTITTYSKPRGMFNIGLTAGQAWELPSKSTLSNKFKDYHRRSRRELYRKLELLLAR